MAREIARAKKDGLFAATPPLEVLKLILSCLATANKGERLMVADVKRAYFYAEARRDIYVEIPEEDKQKGDEDMVGKMIVAAKSCHPRTLHLMAIWKWLLGYFDQEVP